MIDYDWEYHRPDTFQEAVDLWERLHRDGKTPVYYGGGTEIITDARMRRVRPAAVIDLKAIPECRLLGAADGRVTIGAGCTLADVCEADVVPALSAASGRVADHTTRCHITLGGHLAGRIRYREAGLPLLLMDACEVVIAGTRGLRRSPLAEVFDGTLRLRPGDFLAQVVIDSREIGQPSWCAKKTRLDWVDYPLLTVAATARNRRLRIAISGLCDAPFRSEAMEEAFNRSGSAADRARAAVEQIPADVLDDIHGTADFRRFVLQNTLEDCLVELGG